MLIPIQNLNISKPVKGVIHIGAHECEERILYLQNFGLNDSNIIWVDALPNKVIEIKNKYPSIKIFNECISSTDGEIVSFMITNNFQSSSMLNFKTHSIEHPWVIETQRLTLKTKTLNSIFEENNINPLEYNFMNLDIQGAELLALKGSSSILPHIDYIYTEVNTKELYENCALLPELDSFLEEAGFVRVKIEMTSHGWGDAFYIRNILI